MVWKLSYSSEARLATVVPELQKICRTALWLSPIDFGIPMYGGKRFLKEQQYLFNEGKSLCDGIQKVSPHQLGKALDFFAWVDEKVSWEPCHLTTIACAMLEAAHQQRIRLRWGGHFRPYTENGGWDMPHIELIT